MAVVVHPCGNSAVEMVYKFCKPPGNQVAISYKKNKENSKEPFVTLDNGITISGLLTTIKAIVRFSEKSQNISSSLLGKDFLEEAEVEQWLEYCLTQVTPCLKNVGEVKDVLKLLNLYLVDRVYFVGQSLTVADLLWFATLRDIYNVLTFQEKERYIHVSRWFQQVQNQTSLAEYSNVNFLRNLVYS